MADATLTPIPRTAAPQIADQWEPIRVVRVAARLSRTTNLPTWDLWADWIALEARIDLWKGLKTEQSYKCYWKWLLWLLPSGKDIDYIETVVGVTSLRTGIPAMTLQFMTNQHSKWGMCDPKFKSKFNFLIIFCRAGYSRTTIGGGLTFCENWKESIRKTFFW